MSRTTLTVSTCRTTGPLFARQASANVFTSATVESTSAWSSGSSRPPRSRPAAVGQAPPRVRLAHPARVEGDQVVRRADRRGPELLGQPQVLDRGHPGPAGVEHQRAQPVAAGPHPADPQPEHLTGRCRPVHRHGQPAALHPVAAALPGQLLRVDLASAGSSAGSCTPAGATPHRSARLPVDLLAGDQRAAGQPEAERQRSAAGSSGRSGGRRGTGRAGATDADRQTSHRRSALRWTGGVGPPPHRDRWRPGQANPVSSPRSRAPLRLPARDAAGAGSAPGSGRCCRPASPSPPRPRRSSSAGWPRAG